MDDLDQRQQLHLAPLHQGGSIIPEAMVDHQGHRHQLLDSLPSLFRWIFEWLFFFNAVCSVKAIVCVSIRRWQWLTKRCMFLILLYNDTMLRLLECSFHACSHNHHQSSTCVVSLDSNLSSKGCLFMDMNFLMICNKPRGCKDMASKSLRTALNKLTAETKGKKGYSSHFPLPRNKSSLGRPLRH